MDPPFISVQPAHTEPVILRFQQLHLVTAEPLRDLHACDVRVMVDRRDGRTDGCAAGHGEAEDHPARSTPASSSLAPWSRQSLHRTMPRRLHMTQMNVPQLAHGYPSDARSSFPQERQIIASRSWSWAMGAI